MQMQVRKHQLRSVSAHEDVGIIGTSCAFADAAAHMGAAAPHDLHRGKSNDQPVRTHARKFSSSNASTAPQNVNSTPVCTGCWPCSRITHGQAYVYLCEGVIISWNSNHTQSKIVRCDLLPERKYRGCVVELSFAPCAADICSRRAAGVRRYRYRVQDHCPRMQDGLSRQGNRRTLCSHYNHKFLQLQQRTHPVSRTPKRSTSAFSGCTGHLREITRGFQMLTPPGSLRRCASDTKSSISGRKHGLNQAIVGAKELCWVRQERQQCFDSDETGWTIRSM